ncbi:AAA family ATPase [Saccharopolyspora sp. SCSIO 74807]|uniref:AAA family ATPase n=1 Tax=Saccharopolyspora sp. SCSIO 74807 TaxID=3118084 RepID=UPI0030D4FC73
MATQLQIRWIRIRTEQGWQAPYDLDSRVVAIVGVADTGKSSLLECICFALGGDIREFRGAVDRHLLEVEIGIRLPTGSYQLRRSRKDISRVCLSDESGTPVRPLPVRPKGSTPTISEWLLEQLGLLEKFSSVRVERVGPLDFPTDLLPYLHLNQSDIDRHIIRSQRHDRPRLVTLKLLLNLTTSEHERLTGEIEEIGKEISKLFERAETVREFLAESASTDRAAVEEELAAVRAARCRALDELAAAKETARTATGDSEQLRARRLAAQREVAASDRELDEIHREHAACVAELERVEDALAHLDGLAATDPQDRATLPLIESNCPACRTDLTDRVPDPGRCYLCTSLLPGEEYPAQRRPLIRSQERLLARRAELENSAAEAETAAGRVRENLRQVDETLEWEAASGLAPFVDRLAALSAEAARLQAAEEALKRTLAAHDRLADRYRKIEEQQTLLGKRKQQRALAGADVEDPEQVRSVLTGIFQHIVHSIGLPNATGHAWIDKDKWGPVVDGQKFTQRGSGARAAVSIAYSLALLTYSLENENVAAPTLLMVDSPQKNYGANTHDKKLAYRVYGRFLDLMDDRRSWGNDRFARPYQVIIVDNDIDQGVADRILVHRFDREQGFIRDLAEPHGPVVVPVQGVLGEEQDAALE